MPTADGSSAYLVPYDGDVQLLEDTAISRERFFDEISATKPRSATFFFDNCFSGATRSEELLLASRPLGIKVQETSIPDNYLIFTAGETDQIAGVEHEVKHGRFSYFVFKGLEGEADTNSDEKISAGELHKYVRESVGRFSAGSQTPTMLGDPGRWVLRCVINFAAVCLDLVHRFCSHSERDYFGVHGDLSSYNGSSWISERLAFLPSRG